MTSTLPPLAQASAGALSSIVSNALLYPLDSIATRMQTASSPKSTITTDGKPARKPHGLAALKIVIDKMLAEGGAAGFYRGLASDSVSTFISNFLYFYVYSFLRDGLIKRRQARLPPSKSTSKAVVVLPAIQELLTGVIAGIVAKAVVSPLSNITVRAQTAVAAKAKTDTPAKGSTKEADSSSDEEDERTYSSPSSWALAREIYDERGLAGFWRGFSSSILLTSNPAITFYVLGLLKRTFIPLKHQEHPLPIQTFLASAIASSIAATVCYPLILAKTRLQYKAPSGRKLYSSNLDVFRKTLKRQGVQGLFAGLEAQVAKNFFSEGVKMLLKDRLELVIVLLHRLSLKKNAAAH